MFKKLTCLLWGHKFTEKAVTGNTMEITNLLHGELDKICLYKWECLRFCPRCCKPNPYYEELKKKNGEMGKPEAKPGMILNEGF